MFLVTDLSSQGTFYLKPCYIRKNSITSRSVSRDIITNDNSVMALKINPGKFNTNGRRDNYLSLCAGFTKDNYFIEIGIAEDYARHSSELTWTASSGGQSNIYLAGYAQISGINCLRIPMRIGYYPKSNLKSVIPSSLSFVMGFDLLSPFPSEIGKETFVDLWAYEFVNEKGTQFRYEFGTESPTKLSISPMAGVNYVLRLSKRIYLANVSVFYFFPELLEFGNYVGTIRGSDGTDFNFRGRLSTRGIVIQLSRNFNLSKRKKV